MHEEPKHTEIIRQKTGPTVSSPTENIVEVGGSASRDHVATASNNKEKMIANSAAGAEAPETRAAEEPPTSQPTVLPVTYAAALTSPTTLQRRPVTTNDATNEPDQTPTESASDDPPPRPAFDASPKMPTQPDADPDLGNTMEIDSLIVPTAAFLPERRDSLPSSDTEGRTRKQRSPKRRKRRRRTVSGQEETLQVEEDVPVDQHEASEPATADEDVMSAETSIGVPAPSADAELNHERLTGDTTPRTITTSSADKMDDTPVSASTAWHEEEVTEQEPLRDPAPSRPLH
ncbi:uncharacterized protein LOC124795798 [Schistocerca piceifrons]|uniref:uncharacterized protein LOC124795798 n=1 Tax=Schistocerca piceifrons TaxID=274613 RepID=UPI001F5F07C7|nr:uncharacterized protein LOC124795798 [Schistocerca piceifrons]